MAWVSKENKKLFNFVKVSEVRFNSYVIEVIPSSQEGFHCQKKLGSLFFKILEGFFFFNLTVFSASTTKRMAENTLEFAQPHGYLMLHGN